MREPQSDVNTRLYFGSLSALLVEGNALEGEIVTQVLTGFKVRSVVRLGTAAQARGHLQHDCADLILVGRTQPGEGDMDEYDFIRWLRQSRTETIRTASIVLLAGHTSEANIMRARDCGASFVIAKPITPRVIYDRVMWLARDSRAFISTEGYAGPDRRFQKLGAPPNTNGRRKDDLSVEAGDATEPKASHNEVDAVSNGSGARQ